MFHRFTERRRDRGSDRAAGPHGGAESQRPVPAPRRDLPDPRSASLEDLDELIDELVDEELEVSRRRRIVHAELDSLWTERESRGGPRPDGGRRS